MASVSTTPADIAVSVTWDSLALTRNAPVSVSMSTCVSVCLSVCLSVSVSTTPADIAVSVTWDSLALTRSAPVLVSMSTCVSVCLSVCLSVCGLTTVHCIWYDCRCFAVRTLTQLCVCVKFVFGLHSANVSLTVVIVVRYDYYCPVSRNNCLFIACTVSITLYMQADFVCKLHCGHL